MSAKPQIAAPADARADADFLVALGQRVREARERRGMARKLLARAAGMSERYLAQLEAGDGNSSIVLLRRVALALGVPLAELLSPNQAPAGQLASRRKRVALIGLRGAGKSTLGTALAKKQKTRFIELDREIEAAAGMNLAEIFNLYGQAGFRRLEQRCLEQVIRKHAGAVISVGGGIVSGPETYDMLLANCYTVWVKAAPEEHMSRVIAQGDLRPMAGNAEAMADLRRILAAREPLYRKADLVLDTTGRTPEDSLAMLQQGLPPGPPVP